MKKRSFLHDTRDNCLTYTADMHSNNLQGFSLWDRFLPLLHWCLPDIIVQEFSATFCEIFINLFQHSFKIDLMINLWKGMQYLIGKYMSATLDKNPFKILSRTWGKASAKQDILSTTLVLTDMERVFVYDGLIHCFYFSWRSKSHHRKLLFSKFCALHCSLLDKETKWFYGCCFIHDIASIQVLEGTGVSWYMEET